MITFIKNQVKQFYISLKTFYNKYILLKNINNLNTLSTQIFLILLFLFLIIVYFTDLFLLNIFCIFVLNYSNDYYISSNFVLFYFFLLLYLFVNYFNVIVLNCFILLSCK